MTPALKPMLAEAIDVEDLDTYIESDEWLISQKLDGQRLMVIIDGPELAAYNRRGEQIPVPPKFEWAFAPFTEGGTWAFDGELIKGDFWMFDMPMAGDLVTPSTPFVVRHETLKGLWFSERDRQGDNGVFYLAHYRDPDSKQALVESVRNGHGEGLMVKHAMGRYESGRRSTMMLKAKLWQSADCIITHRNRDGKTNAALGMWRGNDLVEVGSVSAVGGWKEKLEVGQVVEVKYLYAVDGPEPRLYQPALLRARDDKLLVECGIDQIHFTDKSVFD
jgi:ATP-dependent DNA ligase